MKHMKHMKYWICVAASFFIFLSPDVWAEDDPNNGESVTFKVNVYGVADQSPAVPTTDRFGGQFNTVTEEQIERQGALDFYDALRNVPGVIYQKKNIIGGQTGASLYIRGRGASHPSPDLTILFDDVPRFGALYGQALADGISIYALGGMEIYKSPQPSRFGSGYGMINFVPKYATREGYEVNADSRGGSHGTVAENFSLGYKKGNFDIYTAQTWLSSEGHVERSAGRQAGYYANIGVQASEHWNIRFMGNYVQARTEAPDNPLTGARSYPFRFDTKTGLMTLTFANKFDNASGWIKAYYNNTKFDLLGENNGARWSRQAVKLSGLRVRETFSVWENGEILAGLDLDKLNLTNTQRSFAGTLTPRVWSFPNQIVFSPFAAVNYFAGDKDGFHFIPSGGIRLYHNTVFDDNVAPQAGAQFGYKYTDAHFSYARAVNYPSPVVLQGFLENTSLPDGFDVDKIKPETANHYEIGATHTAPEKFTIGATWFNDAGKNRTRAYMYGGAPDESFFNSTASEFRISGVELTGKTTPVEDLEIFMGATWLRAKGKGDDGVERDKLPYTPNFTFQAGFNWDFAQNFSLSGDYQHIQDMYSATSMRTSATNAPASNFSELTEADRLPDADVINLRVDYTFRFSPLGMEKAKIFMAIDNVFNNKYAYALAKGTIDGAMRTGYYYMPGTTFMFGVNFGF